MRSILTSMALILIVSNIFAQWNTTTSPPNIFFTGGNVGIGTSTPGYRLDLTTSNMNDGLRINSSTGSVMLHTNVMGVTSYNGLTQAGDGGIVFGNGNNTTNFGFVIVPWQSANSGIRIDKNGKVGIGVSTPLYPLHVAGQIQAETSNDVAFSTKSNLGVVIQQGNIGGDFVSSYNYLSIFAHNLQFNGTNWIRRNQYGTGWATAMNYFYYDVLYAPSNGTGPANSVVTPTTYMRVSSNGSVGIGTTNVSDASYKLFVETGIRTRKVTVDQAAWPDYVFKPDYALPSLPDVASYIKTHQHLPDMPSADSVAKNGIDLGSNQAQLLKKIEELTLYTVDQDKTLRQQAQKLEELERAMQSQQKIIETLKEELGKHRN